MKMNGLRLKKKAMVILMAAVMAVTSIGVMGMNQNSEASAASGITRAKALKIVKAKIPGGVIKYLALGKDDGVQIYRGKVVKGTRMYDIDIKKSTGKIIDLDREYIGSSTTPAKIGSPYTRTQIMEKVRSKVNGSVIVFCRLIKDDGQWVFEGESYKAGGYEYSFEINAFSGRYREWEKDYVF